MRIFTIVCLIVSFSVFAKVDVHQFATPEREALYRELVEELRCLVCQGQNLAGSGSDWAKDVRDVVYEQITDGKTKEEIKAFMVTRFGDSVLYDPPFKKSTIVLWIGPFVMLLIGLIILRNVVRGRKPEEDDIMTAEQKERAERLLKRDIK